MEKKVVVSKAKYVEEPYPQIELRHNYGGAQMLIVVGADGWNMRDYECRRGAWDSYRNQVRPGTSTKGLNVRISTNAAAGMDINQWRALNRQVEQAFVEARNELNKL